MSDPVIRRKKKVFVVNKGKASEGSLPAVEAAPAFEPVKASKSVKAPSDQPEKAPKAKKTKATASDLIKKDAEKAPAKASKKTEPQEVAPKKAKKLSFAFKTGINLLCRAWPNLFKKGEFKPLAIGITKQMKAEGKIPLHKLKRCMMMYCTSLGYHKAVIEGDDRFGLDGQPCGKVSEEEKRHAELQIPIVMERIRNRKASKQEETLSASDTPSKTNESA